MAKLEWGQSDLDFMNATGYVAPREEYEQSNTTALFQQVNMMGAAYNRGKFESMAVDTSMFGDTPFSRENLRSYMEEQQYSTEVVDEVMSNPVRNWEEAQRRVQYVDAFLKQEQQVADNYTTAGMIAAGLPMALIDADSLLIGPALAGVSKLSRLANLSTRMGRMAKVTEGTVAGGVAGGVSMASYEATTGVYRDDSVIQSAALGMALGGTLGFFVGRAPQQNLERTLDADGNPLPTKEDIEAEKFANATAEKRAIDEVLAETQQMRRETKDTKEALVAARQNDRGRAQFDNSIVRKNLEEAVTLAKGSLTTARKAFTEAQDILKGNTAKVKELELEVKRSNQNAQAKLKLEAERKNINKEQTPLKGQLTKINNKLSAMSKERTPAANATRKELKAKAEALQKRLDRLEGKGVIRDGKIGKLTVLDNTGLEQKMAEIAEAKTQQYNASLAFDNARKVREEKKTEFNDIRSKTRPSTKLSYKDVADGSESKLLQEKLAKLGADLSPEGLLKLAERKGVVEADLAKMKEGDFNVKDLYGLRREKKNYVQKLSDELDDIDRMKGDFRESKTFKSLPSWAQKLMISPVEKLLASKNELVRGFTALLHAGTVNHGISNTLNAWNIRKLMDTKQKQMTQGITYNWRQAQKDGSFTGSRDEFFDLVGAETYRTTGAFQKEIFTGFPATVKGIERLELARKKMGSVQRQYFSDNQWVKKSVDNHLDYYEGLWKKGNELDMEAFKGSLGKGYVKRVYSEAKIRSLGRDVAVKRLVEAQQKFAIATGSELDLADALAKAEKAVDSTLDRSYKIQRVTQDLGPSQKATPTSLKQRTIDAFDDDIADILDNDLEGISLVYGMNTHGRLALKQSIGVSTDAEIADVLSKLGADPKELDRLTGVIETILGTREISKTPWDPLNRAIKFASTYTSAMHTLAFAIPTLTEVSSIAKEFGWTRTLDNFIGNPKQIIDIYRNGSPSDKNTIEMMVSYGDAYTNYKVNRADVDVGIDSVGKVQEFMDGVVQKEAIFGGMLPITDMLKMTTASLSVDFLARMSVKQNISNADVLRLGDMGFSVEDLVKLREKLKVSPDGRIGNTDRKSWGKLDEKITLGVQTMVERTILEPNGATLPLFMTNMAGGGVVPRIFMKFMRFPVESYERMLVRGIQEADAKQALAVAGNIAMWSAILTMKDAVREDDKKQYADDDNNLKLMRDSFLYNSWTGGVIAMGDTAYGLATGENLSNDYRYQIGGAVSSKLSDIQQGKVKVNVPFDRWDIGSATVNGLQTLMGIEETNK